MKQFRIIKLLYAESISEASLKERDGIVVDISLVDEFTEEDYKTLKSRREQVLQIINKDGKANK